jgi:hypothetical protein
MNIKRYAFILFLFMCTPSFVLSQTPALRAVRIEKAPVLDGSLSDSCWQSADMATGFIMVEPNPGAPVTQPTKVYVCYDEQNLYLAAYLYEDQPDQIQAAYNQRDGAVYCDDCLEVTIDTYNDKNNAYYFAVNLQSTRTDGRIIDEGRTIDANWDCRWQARAGRDSLGWVVEISIPFSELRYNKADTMTWGINFYRVERPHWETSSWSPLKNWSHVSQYGSLTGLAINPKVKRFELLPFGLAQYQHRTDSLKFDAGLDLKYSLTSDLNFNATYLPDFGQIEADPFQFNLSYNQWQELYLAEKRPFFMEGSSILYTPIKLFYTRRMNEIEAGAKLYGKIGRAELLCLDVQTSDTRDNYSLLRLKHPFWGQSVLGITATNKQNDSIYGRAGGVDLNMPIHGPLKLTMQAAKSANTGIIGDDWAGMADLKWETATRYYDIKFTRMGQEFYVPQGFISTYDIDRWNIYTEVYQRFALGGSFQYVDAGGMMNRKQEIGGRPAYMETWLGSNLVTASKIRFGLSAIRSFERYGSQEFVNRQAGVEFETNVGGMTGVASSFFMGERYEENFRQETFCVAFVPYQKISVIPSIVAVKWGRNKWEWVSNTRISYQITQQLFARTYIQTSTRMAMPAESPFQAEDVEDLNSNLLLGYEVNPGSMFYLVYNHPRNLITQEFDHRFMAKLSYSIRF